ncbi:putative nucleotidyltransferase, ribonuclease H [Tanacetum coccineum]|uniref:Nucleotidyltransferase, ribonuclease H n=1 Tax=Tanacetum coccineum TaxID=301880 RepID=A0ABQ4Z2S0_9ASTR
MPFELCNAPASFQRCMTAIFHDMVEDFMEGFMDDFLVFGNSFDHCLKNLDKMLARCEETNLVLNWEKYHFMVKEGIVLGHKILRKGIEVDKAKIDLIAKLPYQLKSKALGASWDTLVPIIISPDWNIPFELMCDASDFAVGAVLGQRIDGKFKPIYYASKTLNDAQAHYTTTEKELLAVVFSFDKFRPYLILSKTIVYTDHSALKYLFSKQDAKPRLIRLENPNIWVLTEKEIADEFPDEHLMVLKATSDKDEPWLCPDNIMRICVAGNEILEILSHCHSGPTRGHHSAATAGRKVYESGFFWPSIFRDAKDYVCDVFDLWGLDIMGPFPDSRGNKYILVAVDYVSKWVKAQALPTNDARVVVKFLKGLFAKFGVPKALISDRGIHFFNSQVEKALQNTLYNPKDWSKKLNDALRAFKTASKTPTGCTPFRLVYGKACHLLVEIEHKAYWALKQGNMDLTEAAKNRFMALNELMELRDEAYENTRIYKEKTKKGHDSRLRGDKNFKTGNKVLLFNSRFRLHPGKLRYKWSEPFIAKTIYPHGAVEITDKNNFSFKVSGQRLKKYYDGCSNTDGNELSLETSYSALCSGTAYLLSADHTTTLLDPFQFPTPTRRLTMEEMVNKFIEEGRREHEKMDAFIREFKTTNELLLKKRNNSLSELRFEVYRLTRAFEKAHVVNCEIKGVTTRGGKTKTKATLETNIIDKLSTPDQNKPVTPIEAPPDSEPKKTMEQDARPKVLEKHKGAIAWKMADIKGISPSFCTHKILMEESFKPVIQPQRRLNPKIAYGSAPFMSSQRKEECFHLARLRDGTLLSNSDRSRISRKDDVYVPIWNLCLPKDAVWIMQRSSNFPKMYDCNIYHEQGNMDLYGTAKNVAQKALNELMELRDEAYENTRIYKEKTKKGHDSRLRGDKNFKTGNKV